MIHSLSPRHSTHISDAQEKARLLCNPAATGDTASDMSVENPPQQQMYTMRDIVEADLSDDLVVSVCGVLLPRLRPETEVLPS